MNRKGRLLLIIAVVAGLMVVGVAQATIIPPTLVFGTLGAGSGQFNAPRGIAVASNGNIYVSDSNNHRMQVFDSTGNFLFTFGGFGSGDGQFNFPEALVLDPANRIYVADAFNDRIQIFDSSGNFLSKFGTTGSGDGEFQTPVGVAVGNSGRIYVADSSSFRIQVFDNSGNFLFKFGNNGSADGQFNFPTSVTVDSAENIYVTDRDNHRVQVFDSSGNFLLKFGSFGTGNGQLQRPLGIDVDASGYLYVSELDNHRVQVFDNAGNFVTHFGELGSTPGNINTPRNIAVDAIGTIYVADRGNHRVQVFAPVVTGCLVNAPSVVFEGESFTSTVECNNLTQNVYGFEFGTSFTGDISTSATSYTPGSFVTDADPNILVGQNTLSSYLLSRSAPATEATGTFSLGSVDYTANLGLSADSSATITLSPFLLGDILGNEVTGVLATSPNATITIKDLLSAFGTLASEINVNALNNPTVIIDLQTATTPSVVGNSFAFDFNDVFPTNTPTLFVDAESHLECSQTLNLSVTDTDLGTLTILAGDVTDDGDSQTPATIDLLDAVQVGLAIFGSPSGEEDINADGTVNVLDLISVGRNYNAVAGTCF